MRRVPREIALLLALLVCAVAGVLWYVLDRRAPQRAAQPTSPAAHTAPAATTPQPSSAEPVDLTKHDAQTIDFSGGKPVVKDSPDDKAALESGVAEMRDAAKDVTFEAPPKEASPAEPPREKP